MAAMVRTVWRAGARCEEILEAPRREGVVTIVSRRGVPRAAVVAVPEALREPPALAELRGSADGCFGDGVDFVAAMRDEWS